MHTPGPWVSEPEEGRGAWIKGVAGEWTALACGDTDERARDNARLIAAAPDMLEALKAAAQHFEDFGTHREVVGIVKAAIAKATVTPTDKS